METVPYGFARTYLVLGVHYRDPDPLPSVLTGRRAVNLVPLHPICRDSFECMEHQ